MIHAQLEAFEDRNLFLQSLLGGLSFAERLHAVLTASGPSRHPADRDAADDPLLDAVLGLLALALDLQSRTLDAIGDDFDASAPDERRPATTALTPRQLLA